MEVKPASPTYIPTYVERGKINTLNTQDMIPQKNQESYEKISKEMLENRVAGMNEFLEPTQTSMRFQLHEKLQVYYVQVIDMKTEEVLKEIPQKKFLDMYASMAELMGLVVDEKL